MNMFKTADEPSTRTYDDGTLLDRVSVSSMTQQNGELRIDSISVPRSDKTRSLWKSIKRDIKPISDASLKQLPEGASVVALFSNPGVWVGPCEDLLMQLPAKNSERAEMKKNFDKMKPAEDALRSMKGDCAAASVLRKNWRKARFGLVAVGDARTQSAANNAAQQLQKAASSAGSVVKQNGLFNLHLGSANTSTSDFQMLPSWTSRGSWLVPPVQILIG